MPSNWIKTKEQIDNIIRGQEIIDEVYDRVIAWLPRRCSEADLRDYIVENMHKLGAEKESFPTIVAFGKSAVDPHHVPQSDVVLKKDNFVLVDMGVVVGGMCSDFTRTLYYGDMIGIEEKRVYELVKDAQQIGIDTLKKGMKGFEVDIIVRDRIAKKGFENFFVHGTGHGVGEEIHEYPRLGRESEDLLEEGMVVTIEPGIYIPNKFGVRIEDMVIVGTNKRISRHNTELINIVR